MTEYTRHIEEYSNYSFCSFSSLVPEDLWGDKEAASKYLKKYWLSFEEYKNIWEPMQNSIFASKDGLPKLMYNQDYGMMALRGGSVFDKELFEEIQTCMIDLGEKNFVVIQNSQDFTEGEPMFRMKFPTSITWDELISGNYISAVLLEMNYNEYFVFGSSGCWGDYVANDYEFPLHIIGFKPEYDDVFRKYLEQSPEEWEEIRERWLPIEYKNILK